MGKKLGRSAIEVALNAQTKQSHLRINILWLAVSEMVF